MKRFERSNGLDTALYKKNYLYLYICCIGRKAHLNIETVKVNLRDLVKDSLKNEKVNTNLLIETSEQLQKYFENGPHQWKTD